MNSEFTYLINSELDINLGDYTFVDKPTLEAGPDFILPKPSDLWHSTRTVTAMLYQDNVDFDEWANILLGNLLTGPIINDLNIPLTELRWIILNRLIKDNINPDKFFQELKKKTKGNYTRMVASNILKKIATCHFINHVQLYNNIFFTEYTTDYWLNTVIIRDHPIKTVVDYTTNKRGFRNQITCRINKTVGDTVRNINVMIFQNGKLTITGCKCIDEINEVIEFIINLIHNANVLEDTSHELQFTDIQCHSMNYHYSLNFPIDNYKLYNVILESEYYNNFKFVDYDPSSDFSGLKLKFRENLDKKFKGTLCIIFKTGIINIYGGATEEEIQYVYESINSWISIHYTKIRLIL
jgi:TATA-box binding protein (TBP) (component of TFIID and TFIIIB)